MEDRGKRGLQIEARTHHIWKSFLCFRPIALTFANSSAQNQYFPAHDLEKCVHIALEPDDRDLLSGTAWPKFKVQ